MRKTSDFDALVDGRHSNPFGVLGLHGSGNGRVVRTLQPGAKAVDLVERDGEKLATMRRKVIESLQPFLEAVGNGHVKAAMANVAVNRWCSREDWESFITSE